MCSNIYNQTFSNFHFLCGFGFFIHTKKKNNKVRSETKTKKMHIERCKMHKMQDMTFNAWRVLQRSKELDQGPKEQKLNHKNHSSFKWNDFLKWVSHEKWRGLEEWEPEMHIDKELRALNTLFNKMLFSLKSGLPFLAQLPKNSSFLWFF